MSSRRSLPSSSSPGSESLPLNSAVPSLLSEDSTLLSSTTMSSSLRSSTSPSCTSSSSSFSSSSSSSSRSPSSSSFPSSPRSSSEDVSLALECRSPRHASQPLSSLRQRPRRRTENPYSNTNRLCPVHRCSLYASSSASYSSPSASSSLHGGNSSTGSSRATSHARLSSPARKTPAYSSSSTPLSGLPSSTSPVRTRRTSLCSCRCAGLSGCGATVPPSELLLRRSERLHRRQLVRQAEGASSSSLSSSSSIVEGRGDNREADGGDHRSPGEAAVATDLPLGLRKRKRAKEEQEREKKELSVGDLHAAAGRKRGRENDRRVVRLSSTGKKEREERDEEGDLRRSSEVLEKAAAEDIMERRKREGGLEGEKETLLHTMAYTGEHVQRTSRPRGGGRRRSGSSRETGRRRRRKGDGEGEKEEEKEEDAHDGEKREKDGGKGSESCPRSGGRSVAEGFDEQRKSDTQQDLSGEESTKGRRTRERTRRRRKERRRGAPDAASERVDGPSSSSSSSSLSCSSSSSSSEAGPAVDPFRDEGRQRKEEDSEGKKKEDLVEKNKEINERYPGHLCEKGRREEEEEKEGRREDQVSRPPGLTRSRRRRRSRREQGSDRRESADTSCQLYVKNRFSSGSPERTEDVSQPQPLDTREGSCRGEEREEKRRIRPYSHSPPGGKRRKKEKLLMRGAGGQGRRLPSRKKKRPRRADAAEDEESREGSSVLFASSSSSSSAPSSERESEEEVVARKGGEGVDSAVASSLGHPSTRLGYGLSSTSSLRASRDEQKEEEEEKNEDANPRLQETERQQAAEGEGKRSEQRRRVTTEEECPPETRRRLQRGLGLKSRGGRSVSEEDRDDALRDTTRRKRHPDRERDGKRRKTTEDNKKKTGKEAYGHLDDDLFSHSASFASPSDRSLAASSRGGGGGGGSRCLPASRRLSCCLWRRRRKRLLNLHLLGEYSSFSPGLCVSLSSLVRERFSARGGSATPQGSAASTGTGGGLGSHQLDITTLLLHALDDGAAAETTFFPWCLSSPMLVVTGSRGGNISIVRFEKREEDTWEQDGYDGEALQSRESMRQGRLYEREEDQESLEGGRRRIEEESFHRHDFLDGREDEGMSPPRSGGSRRQAVTVRPQSDRDSIPYTIYSHQAALHAGVSRDRTRGRREVASSLGFLSPRVKPKLEGIFAAHEGEVSVVCSLSRCQGAFSSGSDDFGAGSGRMTSSTPDAWGRRLPLGDTLRRETSSCMASLLLGSPSASESPLSSANSVEDSCCSSSSRSSSPESRGWGGSVSSGPWLEWRSEAQRYLETEGQQWQRGSDLLVASAGKDGSCRVSDLRAAHTGEAVRSTRGLPALTALAAGRCSSTLSTPSSLLFLGDVHGCVRLWDLRSSEKISALTRRSSNPSSSTRCLAGSRSARGWLQTDKAANSPGLASKRISGLSVHPESDTVLAAASIDGSVTVWDLRKGVADVEPLLSIGPLRGAQAASFSPSGRKLLCAAPKDRLFVVVENIWRAASPWLDFSFLGVEEDPHLLGRRFDLDMIPLVSRAKPPVDFRGGHDRMEDHDGVHSWGERGRAFSPVRPSGLPSSGSLPSDDAGGERTADRREGGPGISLASHRSSGGCSQKGVRATAPVRNLSDRPDREREMPFFPKSSCPESDTLNRKEHLPVTENTHACRSLFPSCFTEAHGNVTMPSRSITSRSRVTRPPVSASSLLWSVRPWDRLTMGTYHGSLVPRQVVTSLSRNSSLSAPCWARSQELYGRNGRRFLHLSVDGKTGDSTWSELEWKCPASDAVFRPAFESDRVFRGERSRNGPSKADYVSLRCLDTATSTVRCGKVEGHEVSGAAVSFKPTWHPRFDTIFASGGANGELHVFALEDEGGCPRGGTSSAPAMLRLVSLGSLQPR